MCDYFFTHNSKLSQARSKLEEGVLPQPKLTECYMEMRQYSNIFSKVSYRKGFSMPGGITDTRQGPEHEGEAWKTKGAGTTVWEGRAEHSLFLWQEFFLISQEPTLPWPSLIDCADTWRNWAWRNLCCFACSWCATDVEFVPLDVIRLQGWKQGESDETDFAAS